MARRGMELAFICPLAGQWSTELNCRRGFLTSAHCSRLADRSNRGAQPAVNNKLSYQSLAARARHATVLDPN